MHLNHILKMPNCPKCNAKTQKNQPCKLHTCKYAPKCFHHSKVKVGASNIAGRGLIARDDIRKGEIVADYKIGTTKLTRNEFMQRYPTGRATHVWSPGGNVYYDGSNLNKSVAGAANRGSGNNRANARINAGGKLITKQNIKRGSEILVSYGSAFRL